MRFAYGAITRSGPLFQGCSARARSFHGSGPTTPRGVPLGLGLVPVRSPLLRESRLLSFPADTEMFQFPASVRAFRDRRALGRSPGLFAAFHARLLPMTPRHPPRALRSLTTPIRRRFPPQGFATSRPKASRTEAITFPKDGPQRHHDATDRHSSNDSLILRKGPHCGDCATTTRNALPKVVELKSP
jgi:hypothetical protein